MGIGNRSPYLDSGTTDFIFDMILSAASRFRPTSTICELPFVWRLNASAMPWPIPDVPPTNTATEFILILWRLGASLVEQEEENQAQNKVVAALKTICMDFVYDGKDKGHYKAEHHLQYVGSRQRVRRIS